MRTMYAKHDVKLATGTACRKGNAYLIDDSHPEKGYGVWTTGGVRRRGPTRRWALFFCEKRAPQPTGQGV